MHHSFLQLPEESGKARKLSGQSDSPGNSFSAAVGQSRKESGVADSGGVPGGRRQSELGAAAILREYQLRSHKVELLEGPLGLSRKRKLSVETKVRGRGD